MPSPGPAKRRTCFPRSKDWPSRSEPRSVLERRQHRAGNGVKEMVSQGNGVSSEWHEVIRNGNPQVRIDKSRPPRDKDWWLTIQFLSGKEADNGSEYTTVDFREGQITPRLGPSSVSRDPRCWYGRLGIGRGRGQVQGPHLYAICDSRACSSLKCSTRITHVAQQSRG